MPAYQYKLSSIDSCGVESELSNYHRTLLLSVSLGIGTINLSWTAYEYEGGEFTFDRFYIHRGLFVDSLQVIDSISGNYNNYVDDNPPEGLLYYQISGLIPEPCNPSGNLKSNSGTYYLIRSNIEDNGQGTWIDKKLSHELKIYPNPFSDKTTITFPNHYHTGYKLILTDLTGKVIFIKDNLFEENYELSRENLSEGLYLIELRGKNIYRGKIIIE